MKDIKEYIIEKLKQYSRDNEEITVLVGTNVDFPKKTPKELGKLMYKDFIKATQLANEIAKKQREDQYEIYKQETENRARRFAESHWKTPARQQKYVDEQMKRFQLLWDTDTDKLEKKGYFGGEFKIDVDFGKSPSKSIIDSRWTAEYFETMLEEIKSEPTTAEFFEKSRGWEFAKVKYKSSLPYSDYELRFILPKDLMDKIKSNQKRLDKDISDFYSNKTYWGD